MTRQTMLLRVLLVTFLVGLVLASGLLYVVSLDSAALYPKLADLRLPIYVAVAEVVALFLLTLVALLEGLFAAALELRQDNELTV